MDPKEKPMHAALPMSKPLPKGREQKIPKQVYIPVSLSEAVDKICEERDLFFVEAVVFGLKQFLKIHDPKLWRSMGFDKEDAE